MTLVDPAQFRQLLGKFATGVAVLTARDEKGDPAGITVNSVTSVSLDPPLLLVCIDKQHSIHSVLKNARDFVINVLASDQEALSRRFATVQENSFSGVGYHLNDRGVAVIEGALAHYECERTQEAEGGDHTVFLGRVVGGEVNERRPLLYYRGGYTSLGPG